MSLETRLRNTGQQFGVSTGSGGAANSAGLAGTGNNYVLHTTSNTGLPNSRVLVSGSIISIVTDATSIMPNLVSGVPVAGQLLIGNDDGTVSLSQLSAGPNIIITNGDGSIAIESTAGGAASGANADITSLNALSGRLKAPTQVEDSSDNEILIFGSVASAKNQFKMSNAAANSSPVLEVTGDDASVSLIIRAQSGGTVQIGGASSLIVSANSNTPLILGGAGTSGVQFISSYSDRFIELSDGASISIDASQGNFYSLIAQSNRTLLAPSNLTAGFTMTLAFFASGAVRTLSLTTGAGAFRFGTDIPALTSTSANKTDYLGFKYNPNALRLDFLAYNRGL